MRRAFRMSLLALLVVVAPSAFPQSTTATIRGKVTNESGNAVANAEVNAVNAATGFVVTVHSRPDGTY